MGKLLEKKAIISEVATVKSMLQSIPQEDLLGKLGMEQRLMQLEGELSQIEKTPDTAAETIIYFGGEPVEGSAGISTTFAAEALRKYQDYVSIVLASEKFGESLSESGPIPYRQNSNLHITGTPRGSFGFKLSQLVSQTSLTDSDLQSAVEKASTLIELSKNEDSANLQEAIAGEHPRVLSSLKDFLMTLNAAQSSARLVTRDHDVELSANALKIAVENSETLSIATSTIEIHGTFQGATTISRNFDFQTFEGLLIKGKISKDTPDERIHKMDLEYTGKPCVATMLVTEVTKQNSRTTKKRWVLSDIAPL